jgi:hypothetical protein
MQIWTHVLTWSGGLCPCLHLGRALLGAVARGANETGVLDLRTKLLGFHVSGPASCLYMPNKETWRRQRKEIYYRARHTLWEEAEEALSIFSHLWGTDMSCRFK